MTSLATRRRRRRRIVATAGIAILLAVLTVVTVLWRQSVLQTRRAESAKLLTLGNAAVEHDRTQALAFAIASLDLSDSAESRRLALRSLWKGPPAVFLPESGNPWWFAFTPDGSKLAAGDHSGLIRIFSRNLEPTVELDDLVGNGIASFLSFSADARHLVGRVGSRSDGSVNTWETDTWEMTGDYQVPGTGIPYVGIFGRNGRRLLTMAFDWNGIEAAPQNRLGHYELHRWPVGGGEPELIGSFEAAQVPFPVVDLNRGLMATGMNREIHLHTIEDFGREAPKVIARHPVDFVLRSDIALDPSRDRLAVADSAGEIVFWPLDGDGRNPERRLSVRGEPMPSAFSPDGRFFVQGSHQGAWMWDLQGPVGAEPMVAISDWFTTHVAFTPGGRWLASNSGRGVALWQMSNRYGYQLRGHQGAVEDIEFSADGSRLFTQGNDGKVLAWGLSEGAGLEPELLIQTPPRWAWGLAVDPRGRFIIAGGSGVVWKIPLDGTEASKIEDFPRYYPQLDPAGRYLAGSPWKDRYTPIVKVLDLETGERWELEPPGEGNVKSLFFDSQGDLMINKGGVVSLWNPPTATTQVLFEDARFGYPYPDGRVLLADKQGGRWLVDMEDGYRTPLQLFGSPGSYIFDTTGSIIARGSGDGSLTVWSTSEQKPQVLWIHDGRVGEPRISPDGTLIATVVDDGTVRLLPMPDLRREPLHLLPHDEFSTRLKKLTNLRAVPTDENFTGYILEVDASAYRGWAEVPEW
jgi:WD40 repeat protein